MECKTGQGQRLRRDRRSTLFAACVCGCNCSSLSAAAPIVNREDLRGPPGNRLHALEGDLEDRYAISINVPWRICFCFSEGDAYDVEITDYH